MICRDELLAILDYDQSTGWFRWKEKTSGVLSGNVAGTFRKDGYVLIGIKRKVYYAHRLAWLYVYGTLPSAPIDHINRMTHDNRIENLRVVSTSENAQNTGIVSSNKTGFKGVSHFKKTNKWRARLKLMGKEKHLGLFDSPEQAYAAYKAAARTHHTTNPHI